MIRFTRFALLAFSGAVIAGCASLPPVESPVAAPDVRVGDTWTYTIYDGFRGFEKGRVTYRVTAADDRATSVEITRGGQTETRRFAPGWNPYADLTPAGYRVSYDPALPLFQFPLVDGARWSATATATDARTGARFPVQVTARVLGRETVTTPAGPFDTVVIERELIFGDANLWRSDTLRVEKEWYAPAAGASVRYVQEVNYYVDQMQGGGGEGGSWIQVDWDRERLELTSQARAPR